MTSLELSERREISDSGNGATELTEATKAAVLWRRASRSGAFLVALSVFFLVAASVARAEIIDRVLAVVNGSIITLSDARAALRFGLVPPEVSADPVDAALQRLIDRQLVLAEVERYAPPEPPAEEVEAAFARARAQFADDLAFETALTRYGLSREALRAFFRDRLRIEGYLQQRFASVAEPSDEEIQEYYRGHAEAFSASGDVRPLGAVRADVRARVVEERRDRLVRDWLESLRRRASVVVLYLPDRS